MEEKIEIWQVGNTGLRNPNRIQEGFKAFANSPYVGNLRKENEIDFMNFLNTQGIIQNEDGKDTSGSHARKWRLMFSKNGFIYPQVKKKDGSQEKLGKVDDITPFGRNFLKADTYPAVQECYLRAQSVEQFAMPDGKSYFSPLRWILAIMLELERRTGSSEITRIEFALWGHTTNPSYSVEEVVNNILDLRARRKQAPSKRKFDKKEIEERGKHYNKKANNFKEYSDMNMRYLRISGILQRKGRGMIIVPAKHILAEKFYRFSDYLFKSPQMLERLVISSISGILRFGRYPAYHGISEPHLALKSSKTVVETAAYYYAASLSIAAFAEV